MTAERWQKVKELFDAASGLHPKKRDKFLHDSCQGGRAAFTGARSAGCPETDASCEQPSGHNETARPARGVGRGTGGFPKGLELTPRWERLPPEGRGSVRSGWPNA